MAAVESQHVPNIDELQCSLDDITTCPSAQIIKILLKRLQKLRNASNSDNGPKHGNSNELQNANSLHSVIESYDYSVTKLLDDIHHLKYEHGIDRDDAKFDAAYDFFKDIMTENECNIDDCPIVKRYYRDRGRRDDDQKEHESTDLLLDTMSMIHVYLLHSFDTQRFTKEERDRITKIAGSTSWTAVTEAIGADDIDSDTNQDVDDEKNALSVMDMISDVLQYKKGRGRSRFRDVQDDEKGEDEVIVDFATMADMVGVDEEVLRDGLLKYEKDRNKLIGDLIDVVYGENTENQSIWSTLKIENDQKDTVFQKVLYDHFQCIHLDTNNLSKLCRYIVERKKLQIDVERMEKLMNNNNIDGRMFDKGDTEHYQKNGIFAKRFKGIPDCKLQHVRQLYTAVRKWKYVEVKEVAVESKEEEEESEAIENDAVEQNEQSKTDQPNVYAIGKQFLYWKSQRRHRNYVKAKFKDMKQEMMQSECLSQCSLTMKQWNALMRSVGAMIKTKSALKILSKQSLRMYKIKKNQPFDAKHLCALKLYTDNTKLCAVFCSILRRGHPDEIAEIANWVRILTETVQCFGSPLIEENMKKIYFRGVDRTFMFMRIVSMFNLPMSTTSTKLKAMEFGDGGLVVKLGQSATNNARKVMKFECELFSCFPEEQETLFFGGKTELRIKGIIQYLNGWRQYDKFMEPINALNRMMNGLSVKGQPIVDKEHFQMRMNMIIKDHLNSLLLSMEEVDTPQYVTTLVNYQTYSTKHIRLLADELDKDYQWMRSILVASDENHDSLDIANIAVMFSHAESITLIVEDDADFEEETWGSVIRGLAAMAEIGCFMPIRFELSSDEDRQDEMHQMAMGILDDVESDWQCDREDKFLIFSFEESSENDEQASAFQERTETMIAELSAIVQMQKEKSVKRAMQLRAEKKEIEMKEKERRERLIESQRSVSPLDESPKRVVKSRASRESRQMDDTELVDIEVIEHPQEATVNRQRRRARESIEIGPVEFGDVEVVRQRRAARESMQMEDMQFDDIGDMEFDDIEDIQFDDIEVAVGQRRPSRDSVQMDDLPFDDIEVVD